MTTNPEPLLRLRNWSLVRHVPAGGRTILDQVDLDLAPGSWVAVLGANGSGKSSLLKYLASEESPLAETSSIMFQDPDEQIFAASVERELTLGRRGLDVAGILREFGLEGLGSMDPRLLSAGQKQRLVLAVALGGDPRVLLCDEPTALQDSRQAVWVLDRLKTWLDESQGALVTATCDRAEAARADWLVVLRDGRIAVQGPRSELWDSPEVVRLLGDGRPGRAARTPEVRTSTEPLLDLQDVGCRFTGPGQGFRGASLRVFPGARVGITGSNGCGKSTLLSVCIGARGPDTGTVRLGGRLLYQGKAAELDHGAAMIAPQFPEYFFTRSVVAREIALDPALAAVHADEFLEALGLPADLAAHNPHDLSSGQRRRLALGLVLSSGRSVLLLDEPTAALDRAGRAMVLDMLARVDPQNAVVVVSHDIEFLTEAGFTVLELGPEGLAG